VAQRNMASGAQIIAIDLAPIKPIHGVTCVQTDITSEKCRSILKKELKGERADVVLHDGAPNVGASWSKDAYGQSELTLHSMKLACEHLRSGGTFVTKVFRSSDYNSLLWVFNQLFGKVEATKPTASRNVSAEIFVICSQFKNPSKIDPKFYDPKWVFMETVDKPDDNAKPMKMGGSLNDLIKSGKKRHRSGYEVGDDMKIMPAHEFIAAKNPAPILVTYHKLSLTAPGSEEIAKSLLTTEEIREAIDDLKILGRRDLGMLLKWRIKLLREKERAEKAAAKAGGAADEEEDVAETTAEVRKRAKKAAQKAPADDDLLADELAALERGDADKKKKKKEDGSDEEGGESDMEQELAIQVLKQKQLEKREGKRVVEKVKKQEMRKKMSLGSKYNVQDEPDLFRANRRNRDLLGKEDAIADAKAEAEAEANGGTVAETGKTVEMNYLEDTSNDEASSDEASDSDDDELDRLAKLEVDVAVNMELANARFADSSIKHRNQVQRKERKKKETRRQRVMQAWSSELTEFNAALDNQAAAEMLKNQQSDDSDDDSDDEGNLKALRDLQESGGGGEEDERLGALEDGDDGTDLRRVTQELNSASSTSIVPAEEETEEALRSKQRANRWFSQDIFSGLANVEDRQETRQLAKLRFDEEEKSDSDPEIQEIDDKKIQLPLTDKQKRKAKRKKEEEKLVRLGLKKKSVEEDNRPLEIAPLEAPRPLVGRPGAPQKPSDPRELAETLALGSVLTDSKKSRMDIIDASYNRWTFDDDREVLPSWFVEEENRFNKPELPISKELMQQYKDKLREINARPIRKVAEAKARKQRRLKIRIEKLRKTALMLNETSDMSSIAKAREMKKQVRKAMKNEERKVTTVALRSGGGGKTKDQGKRGQVPKGAKTKVVDRRMKNDTKAERRAEKKKGRKGAKKGGAKKGKKQRGSKSVGAQKKGSGGRS